METRVIVCEACSWVGLRVATVMQAAAVVVEHSAATGCDPVDGLIHPLDVHGR